MKLALPTLLDSNKQFHSQPNNRFGIVAYFQNKANLILDPMQFVGSQYVHPNGALCNTDHNIYYLRPCSVVVVRFHEWFLTS